MRLRLPNIANLQDFFNLARNRIAFPQASLWFLLWCMGPLVGLATSCQEVVTVSPEAAKPIAAGDDRAVLAKLYQTTGGDQWENNKGWLTNDPLGTWHGVATDETGRVTSLNLPANGLAGPFPPELVYLTELNSLNLAYNDLTGPLPPGIAAWHKMIKLNLRANALTGSPLAEIVRLGALEEVRLFENQFSGTIPPELGALTNLRRLDLRQNRFRGPIPAEIAELTNLEWIGLAYNALSGPIPPEIANLQELTHLLMRHNMLSGELPPELGALSNLRSVIIEYNRFAGAIPASYVRWTSVRRLLWDHNDGLCAPGTEPTMEWTSGIEDTNGPFCHEPDIEVLNSIYVHADGPSWLSSEGWMEWLPLDRWHGIRQIDSLGLVTALDLENNGLLGTIAPNIGDLAELKVLRIGNNALGGRLPASLTSLESLQELTYDDTVLCVHDDPDLRYWLANLPVHEGTDLRCGDFTDRAVLTSLYHVTRGPEWDRQANWITELPLGAWEGVEVNGSDQVVALDLSDNGLKGRIPRVLGQLPQLTDLRLRDNNLVGDVPPELGALSALERLDLAHNQLSGAIPAEWGRLTELRELRLSGNNLTGAVPRKLSKLTKLTVLEVAGNELVGQLPTDWLKDFTALEHLDLAGNLFAGSVGAEIATMGRLKTLVLAGNIQLSGALPTEVIALDELERLQINDTELCVPRSFVLQSWLDGIAYKYAPFCPEEDVDGAPPLSAYLVQAVQSHRFPVRLIAGRDALLRVFVTRKDESIDSRGSLAPYPLVRTTFFADGRRLHAVDIPSDGVLRVVPTEVEEEDLAASANAEIPGWVLQPGLEMVVETDPDGALADLGSIARRLPETGRLDLNVVQLPPFKLTIIPFLVEGAPELSALDLITNLSADDDLLGQALTLLPVHEVEVEIHDPVWTSSTDPLDVVNHTEAIRVIEKEGQGHWSGGYWMGMMWGPQDHSGFLGVAIGVGRSTVSSPHGNIIAHELLHNMGAYHAPCLQKTVPDPYHPQSDGTIGAAGYDFRRKVLVGSSSTYDVMGNYSKDECQPMWVSDYTFDIALSHRVAHEAGRVASQPSGPRPKSLLLRGSIDTDGTPSLDPAFLVDARPSLPMGGGSHEIVGRDGSGQSLFSFRFNPQEVADDGDGRSAFVFALPVRPEWADALKSIAVAGPGGWAAVDEFGGQAMALLRDPVTGQVLGWMSDWPVLGTSAGALADISDSRGRAPQFRTDVEVQVSRGIPDAAYWHR